MREGAWRTPLGDVQIDTEIADAIAEETDIVDFDEVAHRHEHSIEVQLPFLQYMYGNDFKFVPICFLMQDLETAQEIGESLGRSVGKQKRSCHCFVGLHPLRIASKCRKERLSCLESSGSTGREKILPNSRSSERFGMRLRTNCCFDDLREGLGAKKAEVLSHKTSGDITGDKSSVVGYAAVTIKKDKCVKSCFCLFSISVRNATDQRLFDCERRTKFFYCAVQRQLSDVLPIVQYASRAVQHQP